MRTIAHISDLHFGREKKDIQEALLDDLQSLQPSLVVISGDLTNKALRREFSRARAYLKRIPFPLLVVPGNHDIPFLDVTRRFFLPLLRYKYYITNDLFPFYRDEEMAVMGINTARSFAVVNGRISPKQLAQVSGAFADLPESTFKVVVTHHPFISPPRLRRPTVGSAKQALRQFDSCGVNMLLSGHYHRGHVDEADAHFPHVQRPILLVHAGTTLSRKLKHEVNSFNFLTIQKESVAIDVRGWNGKEFSPVRQHVYERKGKESFQGIPVPVLA